MNKKATPETGIVKRKRGRPKGSSTQQIVAEQAIAYGVNVPVLSDSQDRFLSPNDIAKIMDVTGEAVKQWIYRRKIPAIKLANGYWKVKVTDFEGFLRARTEVGRRHVLITDGGGAGTAEIVEAVNELGHTPVLAHNYPDALLKALDHFPALFVICVTPHDPEAWKFAERIRGNKSLRSFPILIIGGSHISEQDTEKAVATYAQGILARPLTAEVLKQEIQRILQRSM
jgi:CheY-like chemotaxis protein